MANTGTLHACISDVLAELASLGIPATNDPRNARPLAVLVQLPKFTNFTYNVLDVQIPLQVLGAPPGNKDVGDWIMTTVDNIVDSALAITQGTPTTVELGGQSCPAYELTVAMSVKRN